MAGKNNDDDVLGLLALVGVAGMALYLWQKGKEGGGSGGCPTGQVWDDTQAKCVEDTGGGGNDTIALPNGAQIIGMSAGLGDGEPVARLDVEQYTPVRAQVRITYVGPASQLRFTTRLEGTQVAGQQSNTLGPSSVPVAYTIHTATGPMHYIYGAERGGTYPVTVEVYDVAGAKVLARLLAGEVTVV